MSIKYLLARLAAKITGRKCIRCYYNRTNHCCHPAGNMFERCWQSIDRPGFLIIQTMGPVDADEERYNIEAALQEAEDNARESGLLED